MIYVFCKWIAGSIVSNNDFVFYFFQFIGINVSGLFD
jgi:hypothetical protein